ncbi:PID-CTERM protein-sorting domain-containing protein [uncultured Algibacter sp.]|uniref:PID-CTERM protein-sorting domain-containing protein n=1 Tax=uncultured Algibacter sp. TaxID=298659 RepID=UPI002629984A|nr:hypothetical protein [uncultured Algibacter sp.]
MTIQNKRIIASILFVLISFGCMALGFEDPTPPAPGAPSGPPPPPFPIDGGVLLGLIAGLFYGIKRMVFPKSK